MDHSERGIAVGMSVGGKAREIAQGIPQAILGQRNGLQVLLRTLEAELGSELQDGQRAAGRSFEKFQRAKGQSASEYVTSFERVYADAVAHGLAMSRTLLSQKLLDRAGLTEGQELWILQQCNGDYSQYEVIRRAMKRLPSLDHRHNHDANAWMTDAAAAPQQQKRSSSITITILSSQAACNVQLQILRSTQLQLSLKNLGWASPKSTRNPVKTTTT
jgi:hypothetical protein